MFDSSNLWQKQKLITNIQRGAMGKISRALSKLVQVVLGSRFILSIY